MVASSVLDLLIVFLFARFLVRLNVKLWLCVPGWWGKNLPVAAGVFAVLPECRLCFCVERFENGFLGCVVLSRGVPYGCAEVLRGWLS